MDIMVGICGEGRGGACVEECVQGVSVEREGVVRVWRSVCRESVLMGGCGACVEECMQGVSVDGRVWCMYGRVCAGFMVLCSVCGSCWGLGMRLFSSSLSCQGCC